MTNNQGNFKVWLNLIVLCGLLVSLGSASGISMAERGDPSSSETVTQASGMPGRPVPERPISHHEPGQLSRVADVRRDVTRMNAVGIKETVELTGLDALLADGTMSDPFAGNYDVVNLDQILLVRNSDPAVEVMAWSAFEEPDVIVSPTVIPGSLTKVGDTTGWGTPAIAAGDLNGDNQAEQIAAWRDYDTARAFLSIGGLPGTEGKASSDPAAVAHNSGKLDLLVRGYDNALWHRHYNGSAWGEWDSNAGGYLMSGPTTASHGDGQFDVFAAGGYNDTTAIYQRHWTGSAWSADWGLVDVHPTDGVELVGDPAATARGTNQIDLFRRASDNTLRWLHYDGAAWGTWQNLGGFITSAPTVVSWDADHLQVFAQGFDGALWYRDLGASLWGEWQRQDGLTLTSKPAAVSPASNQINIYVRGTDDALWWNHFNGSAWSGWQSLGGTLDSGAAAVLHNTQIELFAQTTDGHLQQNSHVSVGGTGWQDSGGLKTCCWNYDTGVPAGWLDVETGHFTGDGREQIVLAYTEDKTYGVRLYDIDDGFRPVLLAFYEWNDPSKATMTTIDVSTGDLDGDGRDEIGLVVSGKQGSTTNWDTGTYIVAVTNTAPWTLAEKWDDEPVDLDNTYGAFVITSGDLDGNGDDEFVTAWTRCGIPWGWANPYCDAQMILYDYAENWNINSTQVFFHGHGHYEYPDLDLAAADLDLDPETRADEIVYAGIAAPEFRSELSVWSATTFTDVQKIEVETLPVENLPFKLTIGDFNRDLKPEVAFLNHVGTAGNPIKLALYGYDETGTFDVLTSLEQAQTTWSAGGLFDLAAGDLSGESLRVGPPTYRREKSANNIVAILNTPPTHQDTLDGQEYTIGGDDSYSIYEKEEQTENSFSHSFSHNWSLASGGSVGAGEPKGTHFNISIDATYGGHFEQVNKTSHSVLWNQSVQATSDDVLLLSYSDYDIWEYPVYADSDRTPDSYIAVVFPVEGSTGIHTSPGNICQSWYKPTHQVGNLWSYPLDKVDFNGYDPDDDDSHLYVGSITTGGAEYDWTHQMTSNTVEQLSHSESFGLMAGMEIQIGGDEATIKGGILFVEGSTKSRSPFIKGYLQAGYDFEYLGESQASITEQTTVKTHIGTVSPDSSYSSESHLFWAKEGYLKLDYTANPEPHAFWNLYDKPDPTFIRPWADGRCDKAKNDYTRDITIRPFYANRGATVNITATVRNYSNVTANNVRVRFYLGDPDDGGQQIGSDQIIPTLARAVGPETVAVEWTASGSGMQRIYAVVDPDNELEEMHDEVTNVNNNKGYNLIKIGKADYIDPAMSDEHAYYRLAYGQDTGALAAARLLSSSAQTPSLTFDAYVAPDNLGEVILFSFTSLDEVPTAPTGMAPIGDVVALEAFRVGDASQVFDLKPSPALPPGLITVQYSEADLRGTAKEDLRLYTWTGTEWAEPTCAGHALLHLTEDNMFVAPICETGTFALFGDGYEIFLPLVLR